MQHLRKNVSDSVTVEEGNALATVNNANVSFDGGLTDSFYNMVISGGNIKHYNQDLVQLYQMIVI